MTCTTKDRWQSERVDVGLRLREPVQQGANFGDAPEFTAKPLRRGRESG